MKFTVVGQKILKSPGQKKPPEIKNQFHEFFLTKFHFLQFQKLIFELVEKFKTAKNAFSQKKLIYLISRVFLSGLF